MQRPALALGHDEHSVSPAVTTASATMSLSPMTEPCPPRPRLLTLKTQYKVKRNLRHEFRARILFPLGHEANAAPASGRLRDIRRLQCVLMTGASEPESGASHSCTFRSWHGACMRLDGQTEVFGYSLLAVQEHGANLQALLLDSSDDEAGLDGAEDAVTSPANGRAARPESTLFNALQGTRTDHEEAVVAAVAEDSRGGGDAVDATTALRDTRVQWMGSSTIAEQVKLLTGQWMVEGTMQAKICQYGTRLQVRDIVYGIVDEAVQAHTQQERARREVRVRWVRLSRERCRIDQLLNPPTRPGALEARFAARKERLKQEECVSDRASRQCPRMCVRQQAGSVSAGPLSKQKARPHCGEMKELRSRCPPSDFESGFDRSHRKIRDPPGNSLRRAEQKQKKIMAQYSQRCDDVEDVARPGDMHRQVTLWVASPDAIDLNLRRQANHGAPTLPKQAATELLPRIPKILDSVVWTYMRGSGRPAKNKQRQGALQKTNGGLPALPSRAASMQDRHKNDSVLESAHPMQHPQEVHRADCGQTVQLPRVRTAEGNKENRRSASAEPASRMHDIPAIIKVLSIVAPSGVPGGYLGFLSEIRKRLQ